MSSATTSIGAVLGAASLAAALAFAPAAPVAPAGSADVAVAPSSAHRAYAQPAEPGDVTVGADGVLDAATELPVHCTDGTDSTYVFDVDVDGEPARGAVAFPGHRAGDALGMVVFAHGYGHSSASWLGHARWAADQLGLVAVTMDYRGTEQLPAPGEVGGTRGWQVREGAADSNAAATAILAACPGIGEVTLLGVSMGANAAGLALAAHPTRPGTSAPLYDWWLNAEGAANVVETYHEARSLAVSGNAFANNAVADIEREMGGRSFEDDPAGYADLTVIAHAEEIASSGIRGVWHLHGLEDGLVPYDQSVELRAALAPHGLPQQFFTALRRSTARQDEDMTNASGYVLGAADPSYDSPFVGHGSERSIENDVMFHTLERLGELVAGDGLDSCREGMFDAGGRSSLTFPCP